MVGFWNDLRASVAFAIVDDSPRPAPRVCLDCGSPGDGYLVNKGSFLVEILLWGAAINWVALLFPLVLAGLFTIWRRIGRDYHCDACGGRMIPSASPRGRDLLQKK